MKWDLITVTNVAQWRKSVNYMSSGVRLLSYMKRFDEGKAITDDSDLMIRARPPKTGEPLLFRKLESTAINRKRHHSCMCNLVMSVQNVNSVKSQLSEAYTQCTHCHVNYWSLEPGWRVSKCLGGVCVCFGTELRQCACWHCQCFIATTTDLSVVYD